MQNNSIRFASFGVAVAVVGYLIVIALASPLSLQDYPNHLARAVVIADLIFHGGGLYGGVFQVHPIVAPYLLGDLVLVPIVQLLGPYHAAALFSCLVFLSWPLAVLTYVRINRLPAATQLFAVLLAAYFSTDYFFLKGFLEFRLGLAFTVLAVAIADKLRSRHSFGWYCLYLVIIALGYLTHLSALVFTAAAISVSGAVRVWERRSRVGQETALLAPIVLLCGWQFAIPAGHRASAGTGVAQYVWGSVAAKLQTFPLEILRYNSAVLLLLGVCIATFLRGRLSRGALTHPGVREMLALAVAFAAIYFVLPYSYRDALEVDKRALPLVVLFLLFVCFRLPLSRSITGRFANAPLLLAGLLTVVNLAYLERYFSKTTAWAAGYRSIVANVPLRAWVLPVTTVRVSAPYLHAGTSVVIDRRGYVPTLFSENTGDPVKHFRYRQLPYVPDERWYVNHMAGVDWHSIGCSYRFLILTQPFDPGRIEVPTHIVVANASAALLAVDSRACASSRR